MNGLLTWLLPAAALAVGVVLLALGLRGRRVDDHPVCRKCGRDLFGLPGTPDRCPECGRPLRASRIRHGNRIRRPGILAIGSLLALPAVLWLTGTLVLVLSGEALDRHKPVWLLRWEAGRSDSDRIVAELVRRLESAELTAEQESYLIEAFLADQGRFRSHWAPSKGDFLELCQVRGALAPEQWERYVEQGIGPALEVRPVISRWQSLPVRITYDQLRLGTPSAPISGLHFPSRRFGVYVSLNVFGPVAKGASDPGEHLGSESFYGRSGMTGTLDLLIDLTPDLTLHRSDSPANVALSMDAGDDTWWQTAAVAEARQPAPLGTTAPASAGDAHAPLRLVSLLPAPQRSVRMIGADDPGHPRASDVREPRLHVDLPRWYRLVLIQDRQDVYDFPHTGAELTLHFNTSVPPGVYRISVGDGRKWRTLGTVIWRDGKGTATGRGWLRDQFDCATVDRVTIILTPDRDAAERTIDIFEICGGEIVLEDVPVSYPAWFLPYRAKLAAANSGASTSGEARATHDRGE